MHRRQFMATGIGAMVAAIAQASATPLIGENAWRRDEDGMVRETFNLWEAEGGAMDMKVGFRCEDQDFLICVRWCNIQSSEYAKDANSHFRAVCMARIDGKPFRYSPGVTGLNYRLMHKAVESGRFNPRRPQQAMDMLGPFWEAIFHSMRCSVDDNVKLRYIYDRKTDTVRPNPNYRCGPELSVRRDDSVVMEFKMSAEKGGDGLAFIATDVLPTEHG